DVKVLTVCQPLCFHDLIQPATSRDGGGNGGASPLPLLDSPPPSRLSLVCYSSKAGARDFVTSRFVRINVRQDWRENEREGKLVVVAAAAMR
ncbi:hypothetical protein J6590_073681, partial [Homalodisca vitripennis]